MQFCASLELGHRKMRLSQQVSEKTPDPVWIWQTMANAAYVDGQHLRMRPLPVQTVCPCTQHSPSLVASFLTHLAHHEAGMACC